jgi:hypothetical protein
MHECVMPFFNDSMVSQKRKRCHERELESICSRVIVKNIKKRDARELSCHAWGSAGAKSEREKWMVVQSII